MTPGLAGTPNIDLTSLSQGQRKQVKDGDILPVVEFNEYTGNFTNAAFYNNNKPLHPYQYAIYQKQGLEKDIVRGPLSSSSQRESPSYVFGISTPGRPVDDPADDPNYLSNLSSGKVDSKYQNVKGRKGGHVFLMDDGSTLGQDQLIRLRSAGGHQILMHDTNESVYIAHANGYSWVELTKDGKVLIYSKNGFALNTDGDINFKAGGSFNVEAGDKINIKSGAGIGLEASAMQFLADGKLQVTAPGGTEFKTGAFKVDASAKISLKAGGAIAVQGASFTQQSGGVDSVKSVKAMQTHVLPDTISAGGTWTSKPGALKTIVTIAPTHEPYDRGTKATAYIPESAGIQPGAYNGSVDATKDTTAAPLTNTATVKDIRNAPPASEAVGSLSKDQTTALLAQLSKGNDYTTTGEDGALGKYQADFKTLQAAGYIKSTATSNADLQNPNMWTNKGGINNAGAWLANTSEQENVMLSTTKQNYTTLLASGAITSEQTPDAVAGMMSVAHKLGPDAAKTFREGSGPGAEYFNQGKFAISVLAPQIPAISAG